MKLTVAKDQAFKICQLTDIHLSPLPLNEESKRTVRELTKFLQDQQFDLLIVTGDLLWGLGNPEPEATLLQLYEILNQTKTPVAITYGNHDAEGDFSRQQLRGFERHLKYLADKHDSYTVFDRQNYVLDIYCDDQIRNKLYVFDSGDYGKWGIASKYAVIEPEQIMWYLKHSQKRDVNNCDLSFLHIPLPEYRQAVKEELIAGQHLEEICCGEPNSGLFYAFERQKNVKGVFAGHDHDNNFQSKLAGIELNYGNISGYNTYCQFARGARIINLYADHFTTELLSYPES